MLEAIDDKKNKLMNLYLPSLQNEKKKKKIKIRKRKSIRKKITAKIRTVCTAQRSLYHFFVDLNGKSNQWLVCIDELNEDKKKENAKMVKYLKWTERGQERGLEDE